MKARARTAVALLALVLLALPAGCANKDDRTLAIAEQYGLAYAPLQVMREKGYLEEALGDERTIEWVKLANTAAIREAMLSGGLDIGFVGIPPFLIGADTGMPWRIMAGLSESPLGLVVKDEAVRDLADLAGGGKIALPQPGSIQHILLAMAAKKELGDAKALDGQLVSMKHPDGMQALAGSTEVAAHYTAPPYLFQELETPGHRLIATGEEAMGGPFTFIVAVCLPAFREDEAACSAFMEALERSIAFMKSHPEETAALLAESYGLTEEAAENYLYERGIAYGTGVRGVQAFADFMHEEGYLKNSLKEEALLW